MSFVQIRMLVTYKIEIKLQKEFVILQEGLSHEVSETAMTVQSVSKGLIDTLPRVYILYIKSSLLVHRN